jgi:hypothetical protein
METIAEASAGSGNAAADGFDPGAARPMPTPAAAKEDLGAARAETVHLRDRVRDPCEKL